MRIILLTILFLTFWISLYNLFTAPRFERLSFKTKTTPRLSILVPVRNEEGNILKCLNDLFRLSYPDREIIIYDDRSTDSTLEMLEEYRRKEPALHVIRGREKPEGWTGKSWACHNLFNASGGEVLLFVDADVSLNPDSLEKAVAFLEENNLSLLSCFSRQIMSTPGEWMVVPVMNWILLSLLPLKLVYMSGAPSLAAANGQFMLFSREAYREIGGHEAVKDKLVEDVSLANLIKKNKKPVMTVLSLGEVSCRMYRGLKGSIDGFTKNFFPGFNMPKYIFTGFIFTLFAAFFAPFVLVFFDLSYIYHIGLICLIRTFISISSKQNIVVNILLHPVQMIMMLYVGLRSAAAAASGNIYWKGRRV